MKKILGFAGSNSSNSINHELLASIAKEFDVEFELISLRDFEAPLFGVDLKTSQGVPSSIQELHQKMAASDGFIVSIAEHNGSMTAVLKNTFDWLSMLNPKFFLQKPTAFISTSPGGRGAMSALSHVVDIMPHRGAAIVGHLSIPNFSDNINEGVIREEYRNQLIALIRDLEKAVNKEL
jgi:NAD(P)H-dependent FMN reductase